MLSRCRDKTNSDYGAKGIDVCDEWLVFETFYAWAISAGYKETLTIERLDNDLGYRPSNCTWADKVTQSRHRSIVKMSPDGRPWAEIAEENGIPVTVMNNRVSAGKWPIEVAATWPVGKRRSEFVRDDLGRMATKTEPLWRR